MSGPMQLPPFANKAGSPPFPAPASLPSGLPAPPPSALAANLPEIQRAQMMEFSQRLRAFGLPYGAVAHPQIHSRLLQVDPLFYLYGRQDPRLGFFHEEPKPSHSYIGLIGMGILSSKEKKLVLSDIYQWILDNYPYFRTRGPGWRNSIRHNLSLNDCFIKSGRAPNGKGHYWAIHPAVVSDFEKGDFRRRRAQRKVRKAMGLAVPDEEDDSGSPPPPCSSDILEWRERMARAKHEEAVKGLNSGNGDLASPAKSEVDIKNDNVRSPSSDADKDTESPMTSPVNMQPSLQAPLRPFPSFPLNRLAPMHWKHLYQNPMIPIPRLGGLLPPGAAHFLNNPKQSELPISPPTAHQSQASKRRAFDVESLLALDVAKKIKMEDATADDHVTRDHVMRRHENEAEEEGDIDRLNGPSVEQLNGSSVDEFQHLNQGNDSDIDVDDGYDHLSD